MKPDLSSTAAVNRNALFWKLQFAGWTAFTLLGLSFMIAVHSSSRELLLLEAIRSVFGLLVTCGLRYPYRRMWKRGTSLWWIGGVAFLGCGLVGLVDAWHSVLVVEIAQWDLTANRLRHHLSSTLPIRWLVYWAWSLLYFGINYWLDTQQTQLRLARAEAAARDSELRLLRAQVNPHFLFNALNSILASSKDSEAVRSLTLALSEYLRHSFENHAETEFLEKELDLVENYLRVEKARFEDNLEYRIDADSSARRAPVPTGIVQPLLDNAVKYGQRSVIRPLRIAIEAKLQESGLVLRVRNTGEWIDPESHESTKTGLANLQRRLELLPGDGASLDTESADGEVVATLRLPVGDSPSHQKEDPA